MAGLDSLRRFRMGGDLQRLLLLLLVPWVYRETGCRRSEPRIPAGAGEVPDIPSSCVNAMPVKFMSAFS